TATQTLKLANKCLRKLFRCRDLLANTEARNVASRDESRADSATLGNRCPAALCERRDAGAANTSGRNRFRLTRLQRVQHLSINCLRLIAIDFILTVLIRLIAVWVSLVSRVHLRPQVRQVRSPGVLGLSH